MNKVYSVTLNPVNVAAGGSGGNNFHLYESNRYVSIKSILFDYYFYYSVSNLPIYFSSNTTQSISLAIGGTNPGSLQGGKFSDFSTPADIWMDGGGIKLCSPGQYIYDNWTFINDLYFALSYYNREAVLATSALITIAVEAELLSFNY